MTCTWSLRLLYEIDGAKEYDVPDVAVAAPYIIAIAPASSTGCGDRSRHSIEANT